MMKTDTGISSGITPHSKLMQLFPEQLQGLLWAEQKLIAKKDDLSVTLDKPIGLTTCTDDA